MKLADVNVLVAAHRTAHVHHVPASSFIRGMVASAERFALTSTVTVGTYRIVTNRRAFPRPSTPDEAFEFLQRLLDLPQAVRVEPGPRHWEIFRELCRGAEVKGALAADAHLAALAIEHGATLVSFDRDFARFKGLRWVHPNDED